jgi:hypothetical protein
MLDFVKRFRPSAPGTRTILGSALALAAVFFAGFSAAQAAPVKQYRVTALTNETAQTITFQWKYSDESSYKTMTLKPGQHETWTVPWTRKTADSAPKVVVRFVGLYNAAAPVTEHVLQGHVVQQPSYSIANHYVFYEVNDAKFRLRKTPTE